MKRLLALTLFPEWAFGVCYLGKDRENKSRRPPRTLIGDWFAIHGGAYIGGSQKLTERRQLEAVQTVIDRAVQVRGDEKPRWFLPSDILTLGRGIVAIARLEGVTTPPAKPDGWQDANKFGLRLADMQLLREPVPARGMPGFWPVPQDLITPIVDRLPAAAPAALREILKECSLGE